MRLITTIVFLVVCAGARAQYVNIPDSNFRNALKTQFSSCFNGAGELDTICAGNLNNTFMYVVGKNIADLNGIRYFKSLKTLHCGVNLLISFPQLPDSLQEVYCENNLFTSIPGLPATIRNLSISGNNIVIASGLPDSLKILSIQTTPLQQITSLPNGLLELYCSGTQLSSLPVLPNSLQTLICNSNNKLTALPALPNALIKLDCSLDSLTALPILPNSLKHLYCYSNLLTALPLLPDSLKYLYCYSNLLTNLPTLPDSLRLLHCYSNNLTNLPSLPNQLIELYCYKNSGLTSLPAFTNSIADLRCNDCSLTTLPALPNSLIYLICDKNVITNLPVLPNSLRYLSCYNNQISSLPTLPDSLTDLICINNYLTSLPSLPAKLKTLDCLSNFLTYLPALPGSLTDLSCGSNRLTSLPNLPNSLIQLNTFANLLTSLPSLPSNMLYLNCSFNPINILPVLSDSLRTLVVENTNIISLPALPGRLTGLYADGNNQLLAMPFFGNELVQINVMNDSNLHCLPLLPKSVNNLTLQGSGIKCLPNIPVNCITDISIETCNPINNIYNCQSYPQIYGFIFNDNNSNGIYDVGDNPRQHVRTQLNNGLFAYSNESGYFNMTTDTLGSYTIDITPPPFFSPLPFSNIHNFTSYNDVVYDTFALQPLMVVDSLAIHITPMQPRARPGFPFAYHVQAENVGTTILTTTIKMKFDATRLTYDSASAAGIVVNGDSLVLSPGILLQGQTQTFRAYFHVKPTAIIGDSLRANAAVQNISLSNYDTTTTPISGSYDPNSKQATPNMTPTQLISGAFVEYIIHFQNTGTDTAFTIVIVDTLSPKLRTNFLQMLGTSHPCKTTLGSGVVTFEFLSINLPDSNTNLNASKGFIHFRIRPDSTLTLGDSVPNKASIYFDFNTPFETNTVQTHIKYNLLPLRLATYKVFLKENKTAWNEWATTNEMNTSHFNVQRSNNGKDFTTIGRVNAKGTSSIVQMYHYPDVLKDIQATPLYYRLEIVDFDGKKTYSAIEKVRLLLPDGLSVYPNPAHKTVTIAGENMQQINILDNAGRIVTSKILSDVNIVEITVGHLPQGVYMIRVAGKNGNIKTEKLLIE